jgi:hypothetical protein
MGWFSWLTRSNGNENRRTQEWRRAWAAAVVAPDAAVARDLRARLADLAGNEVDDDVYEIEREMLDGLDALVELASGIANGGPPTIPTGHRAVGADRCHFSAPVSLPDDPAQPSGTLLLTSTRMVFVGGARSVTIPWHSIGECTHHDRDVLLVRVDRQDLHRIRCNTFADALRAAFLARHLASRRRV